MRKRRAEVVDAPCMLSMKRNERREDYNYPGEQRRGKAGKEVVFAGERGATVVARKEFQRGEGSGLGTEKKG